MYGWGAAALQLGGYTHIGWLARHLDQRKCGCVQSWSPATETALAVHEPLGYRGYCKPPSFASSADQQPLAWGPRKATEALDGHHHLLIEFTNGLASSKHHLQHAGTKHSMSKEPQV